MLELCKKEAVPLNIEILEKPRIIMSNPQGLHKYFAWPTVTRLKDGRLALAASGFRLKHICPFGKVALSFSDDEGKTWSIPAIAVDTVLDDRDAGLCPFGDDGLIVTSFNNTTDQQRRWAEGEHAPDDKLKRQSGKDDYYTYKIAYLDSVPADAEAQALGSSYSVSFNGGRTFERKFIAPITSPHGPVELKNGKILWVGRTFGGENERVEAHEITLDGKTAFLGAIENVPGLLSCEPHAIELENGRILCHIRMQPAGKHTSREIATYQSTSDDGGRTWTKPQAITSPTGGAPAHLMIHSSETIVSAIGYRDEPFGIRVMLSDDGGESWQTEVLADGYDSSDLGYPATVELKDGSLYTVYYAHERVSEPAVIFGMRWKLTND